LRRVREEELKALEYDTPALMLDIEAAERNIQKMAEYVRRKNVNLRPHVKVHKSPFLAQKQIAAGAQGITCAKVSEAEVMANAGIGDILVANQIVGETKLRRLLSLAKRCNIAVLVDNLENAKEISRLASEQDQPIGVLVEVNLGIDQEGILDRCGVPPGKPVVQLASDIAKLKNVKFNGLMGYEGSLRKFPDRQSMESAAKKALGLLIESRDDVVDSGLDVQIVSCGGTMSYNIASEISGVTEIQAGSYIFMDTTYLEHGIDFEISLTVLSEVVSRPRPEKVITDAGLKAISGDHGLPSVKGRPDLQCTALNAEHGHFRLLKGDSEIRAGDKLEILLTRADTTVCLHDKYVIVRRGEIERELEIACRGKLQ